LAPGAVWTPERKILDATLFDRQSGRLSIRRLAAHHVAHEYRAKSVRCADCAVNDRCEGAHINMIRDQGLGMLTPLGDGAEGEAALARLAAVYPEPPSRLSTGRPAEPVAASLPGYPEPTEAPADPLAVIAQERMKRREQREKRRLVVLSDTGRE
jgi:hypothetical protein